MIWETYYDSFDEQESCLFRLELKSKFNFEGRIPGLDFTLSNCPYHLDIENGHKKWIISVVKSSFDIEISEFYAESVPEAKEKAEALIKTFLTDLLENLK